MTTKKIYLALLGGVIMVQTACNARKVDDGMGTYESGPDGASDAATATDRAETTVASTDTAALILPADTAGREKKQTP